MNSINMLPLSYYAHSHEENVFHDFSTLYRRPIILITLTFVIYTR